MRVNTSMSVHGIAPGDIEMSVSRHHGFDVIRLDLGASDFSIFSDDGSRGLGILAAIRDTAQAEIDRLTRTPDPAQTDALEAVQ